MNRLVVIKGAGDIATGVAYRLFRSGFTIIMTELAQPMVIRRTVAFAQAIFSGQVVVEDIVAVKTQMADVFTVIERGQIPVVVDPQASIITALKPWGLVDAILAKRNVGTKIADASIVVGIGPGFTAGYDVHAIIESMRGHDLGRVIMKGQALPDTGVPGEIGGYTKERILRAPCQGVFMGISAIGDYVTSGDVVAHVNEQPIIAGISGILRGLLHNELIVKAGMKIGDIDARCVQKHCFSISDKARAIGGGVLEALMYASAFPRQTK
jgi:xanthine dehydrogenase accessory factor